MGRPARSRLGARNRTVAFGFRIGTRNIFRNGSGWVCRFTSSHETTRLRFAPPDADRPPLHPVLNAKYSFHLRSQDKRRDLPDKIILGQDATGTVAQVMLKLLAYLLFHRERLKIGTNLHLDSVPFVPDVAQLDFQLRPVLWVECGECSVGKLHKLAVKVPEAELWVVKRSVADAESLSLAMAKMELRRDRYNLIGFDEEMFDELCGLLQSRNELLWVSGGFDPPNLQFDFNGLWFDAPFTVLRY